MVRKSRKSRRNKRKSIRKSIRNKKTRIHNKKRGGAASTSPFYIHYGNVIIEGQDLTGEQSVYSVKPSITIRGNDATKNKNKTYTIVALDPDAPAGTWTHWVATISVSNSVSILAEPYPYQPPSPPANSGKHRYIFNLYNELQGLPKKSNDMNGHDYYTYILDPILKTNQPISTPVMFTVNT